MSLKTRTAKNIGYVAVIHLLGTMVNVVTLLVLALLLDAGDFGIIAIGLVVLNALNQISDMGITSALVQKQDGSARALSTGLALRMMFSLGAFAAIVLSVPYWASVFGGREVVDVVRVMSLIIIITSFSFGPMVRLTLKLDFRKISIAQAYQNLSYAGLALTLLFLGWGYWAVVWGHVMSWVVWVAILYAYAPVPMRMSFDREKASGMLSYGKHVFAAALVIFAITNLPLVFVGAVFGLAVLGFYDMANKWGTIAATQLTLVVNKVMFPTYAKIREEKAMLRAAYLKTMHYVSVLSVPMAVGLMAVAPEFIRYVITDKWEPSYWPLMILCLFGLMRSLSANSGSVFKAVGRPDMLFKISLLSLILKIALIWYFIERGDGIIGVAFAITASSILITQLNVYYCCVYTGTSARAVMGSVAAPMAASVVMAGAIMGVKMTFAFEGAGYFLFLLGLGVGVYFVALAAMSPGTMREGWEVFGAITGRGKEGGEGTGKGKGERTRGKKRQGSKKQGKNS
jgi:O-antigen/teichoic acid export membrane protein